MGPVTQKSRQLSSVLTSCGRLILTIFLKLNAAVTVARQQKLIRYVCVRNFQG